MRAWIETIITDYWNDALGGSHAVCVRGLKLLLQLVEHQKLKSHAVCVRGLKQEVYPTIDQVVLVARRVRAWIETVALPGVPFTPSSHAVCVRGLKQLSSLPPRNYNCRTPCACVD